MPVRSTLLRVIILPEDAELHLVIGAKVGKVGANVAKFDHRCTFLLIFHFILFELAAIKWKGLEDSPGDHPIVFWGGYKKCAIHLLTTVNYVLLSASPSYWTLMTHFRSVFVTNTHL